MPKVLCISGMAIAGVILILFLLDMIIGFPFKKAGGLTMDIVFSVCAVGLGYLAWSTYREQD